MEFYALGDYSGSMLPKLAPLTTGVTLLVGFPSEEPLLDLVAQLALVSKVQVVVGGNCFDAHKLARLVRRRTVALDETLERIGQTRPFTANQTVQLINELEPTTPIIVLDLLTTFYDENISDVESVRLVRLAGERLYALGEQTAVIVTARKQPTSGRAGLIKLLHGTANRVYLQEQRDIPIQKHLF